MLNENAVLLKNELDRINFNCQIEEINEQTTHCKLSAKLKNGQVIKYIAVFKNNNDLISIFVHNCFGTFSDTDIFKVKEFANILNIKYTYVKFHVSSNKSLNSTICYLTENFSTKLFVKYIKSLAHVIEREHPAFMKLIWS